MRTNIAIFKPAWLLTAIVYFLVFYSLYMQFDGYNNYNLKLLMYVAITGLTVLQCFLSRGECINNKHIIWLIIFIVVITLTSYTVTPSVSNMLNRLSDMIMYTILTVAIFVSCKYRKERIEVLMWIIVLAGVCCSIALMVRGVDNHTGGLVLGVLNQNEFSNIVLLGSFCSLYLLLIHRTGRMVLKLILIIATILMYYSGLLGGSRKFFAIALTMAALYFIFCIMPSINFKKKKAHIMFFFGVIVLTFGVYFAVDYAINHTIVGSRLFATGYYGDEERLYFYQKAWEYFLANPLFGLGVNGFSYYEGKYSHSIYAELLSCTGLTGMVIFFYNIGSVLKKLMLYVKSNKTEVEKRFLLIYLIAMFVNALFTPAIYAPYFYITLGISFSTIYFNKVEANHRRRSSK